jgi:hypothetical protein
MQRLAYGISARNRGYICCIATEWFSPNRSYFRLSHREPLTRQPGWQSMVNLNFTASSIVLSDTTPSIRPMTALSFLT